MSEVMFIKATREKFRFPYKGKITVEDLWDLPVTELDKIYKVLNSEARKNQEDSLLDEKTDLENALNTQIDIIKYIVSVKIEEVTARKKEKENAEQRQKIMGIIDSKRNEELSSKSIEELNKMLDDLK